MSQFNAINPLKIDQANELFGEIATAANSINELLSWTDASSQTDFNAVGIMRAQIDVVRTLVARMGWMADMGREKLQGRADINGGAEQWLVNPVYAAKGSE